MANSSPRTDHIENFLFQPVGEIEGKLSRKPLQFVVEEEIHEIVMSLPKEQRIPLLRQWVKDGVRSLQQDANAEPSEEPASAPEPAPSSEPALLTKKQTKSKKSKKPSSAVFS